MRIFRLRYLLVAALAFSVWAVTRPGPANDPRTAWSKATDDAGTQWRQDNRRAERQIRDAFNLPYNR